MTPGNETVVSVEMTGIEISEAMLDAGVEAFHRTKEAMYQREKSGEPVDFPDYDESDLCRFIYDAMAHAARPSQPPVMDVERVRQIASDMRYAVAQGMAWISHSEAEDFAQRLERIADLAAMQP